MMCDRNGTNNLRALSFNKNNLVDFTMAYRPVDIHPVSKLPCHALIAPVYKKYKTNDSANCMCGFHRSYRPLFVSHTELQPSL